MNRTYAELHSCNSTHNGDKPCGKTRFPPLLDELLVGTLSPSMNARYFPLLSLLAGISLSI